MKNKCLALIAALLVCALLPAQVSAGAESAEAADITESCTVKTSGGKFKVSRLWDRQYRTAWVSDKIRRPWIEVTAPEEACGVYVAFGDKLRPWQVQAKRGEKWETVYESAGEYAHEYAPLDGVKTFRILYPEDRQTELSVSEIWVFGAGSVPGWVQMWEPPCEKADLMVLSAHPDDEILFFGGAIPWYAGEMGLRVQVAYMTCNTFERRSELLDGLWLAGVRNYPVIGDFWDKYSKKIETAYDAWGKKKTDQAIVRLLRQFRPEVLLTHDVNGEYGHGAHKVCADAAQRCFLSAADGGVYPDLGEPWQVKKLYLHLYPENPIEMDWDRPMASFDGKTGYETAAEMYRKHVSQQDAGQKNDRGVFERFQVEPRESRFSCYRFGLACSTVGEDSGIGEFFENIPGFEYLQSGVSVVQ